MTTVRGASGERNAVSRRDNHASWLGKHENRGGRRDGATACLCFAKMRSGTGMRARFAGGGPGRDGGAPTPAAIAVMRLTVTGGRDSR
jgi:hypothetical protein